jgi:parvulin-like peptidyl-prolyl isomerase
MTYVLVLAAALATAAPPKLSARAFLSPVAASTPGCRVQPEGDLYTVGLFSSEGRECPVARVGDSETIRLGELAAALEARHLARSPGARMPSKRPDMDYRPILDRLVTTRLFYLEAKEMQLDQTAEFKDAVEKNQASTLREMLQQSAARTAKVDPAEVERLYREAVREWKIASVLVDKEEDAKAFVKALEGGTGFEALAKKLAAEKKGRGNGKSQFVTRKKMLPEILAAVQGAKQGAPIGPVKLPSGWVVLRVDGVRYPKDASARDDARAMAQEKAEHEAIRKFYDSLVKRDAVIDEALFKQLDFEAGGEKGFEALASDTRPVVTIRADRPITVGDLAREIASKFFHGLAGPINEHKLNIQKRDALERLLGTRLLAKEAAARKLASTPEYRRQVDDFERVLAFNMVIDKVIAPDVKIPEAEGLKFYEEHRAQITSPEMYKLDGFAFVQEADARAALDKLKGGTDFAWLRSTAPGQVPIDQRRLQFDGNTVSVTTLPPDLARTLTGTRAGEYRLYAASETEVYVIRVVAQTPPSTKPYAEVRESIAKKLYEDKMTRAIDDYGAKLRKVQRVDVLIARVSA